MLMTTIEVQQKLRAPARCTSVQIMCGSTYTGLVRPSDLLIDKICIIDVNWFERMSKKKITFINRLVLRFI